MSVPYRTYLYVVLTASAFIAITGAVTIASYVAEQAWPGRVIYGNHTTELASGLARLIVAGPIWLIHWRLAARQVARDPGEQDRLLRQAYLLILTTVTIILVAVSADQLITGILTGDSGEIRGSDLGGVVIWGAAWLFHWRVVRMTWRPGSPGRQVHRFYLYVISAGSLGMFAFGTSIAITELLRSAYESTFQDAAVATSGLWTRSMQEGIAAALVGGTGWIWHWWRSASDDGGSVLREVYATGASAIGAAAIVSVAILSFGLLIRPAFGVLDESLAAHWDGLPRLAADLVIASAIWFHLSSASPWSRRGTTPTTALPGALTVDVRAWEVFGIGAIGAAAVILIALLLSLPVVATRALLVDSSSRMDAFAAIVASAASGVVLAYFAFRRGSAHDALDLEGSETVTRFFQFGVAAAGLLSAVGGAAAALFIFLNDLLNGDIRATTMLDARWGIAIGLVGAAVTAWRWRAIQEIQHLRGAKPEAAERRPLPKVRVVHAGDLEVEVSSGAMTRLAGVSRGTVGAKGIHLAIATIPAGQRSGAHYHTNCESAIYVASGNGTFLAGEDLTEEMAIGPGDFIYVPPDAPHQPVNGSMTEPLVLIVARDAPVELVVELPEVPPKLE